MPLVASSSSRSAEEEPLIAAEANSELESAKDCAAVEVLHVSSGDDADVETDSGLGANRRQLGLTSTVSLIFNRIIGTGIFATPSVILRSSGSVGVSLLMWLFGSTVALCGTAVYLEFGTGLPRNGGEKNYLEFIYRRPKLLVTCMYAMYAALTGWQAASAAVFGEYVLHAIDPTHPPSPMMARLAGVACMTFALVLHGTALKAGLRVQNVLGMFKLFILIGIAVSGLASLFGVPGFKLENPPNNFQWDKMWEGSFTSGANAFVTGLFNVIWCYDGYSNANYALGEVRDPIRTIKRAAPLALFCVTTSYMFVNIAYYVVVDKDEIAGSGRIAAALYFGKLFGINAERLVSVIIAFSSMGAILGGLFTHGRLVQELGREGVLPFSSFFASNKPFNTPFAGLFEQWFLSSSIITLVPPGDAYLFMLNLCTYPMAVINTFVAGGLLFIHFPDVLLSKRMQARRASYGWLPPFRAWTPVVLIFFLANIFLVFAPFTPPEAGYKVYDHLPYFLHVLVSWSIACFGAVYWYVWCVWKPRKGGYVLVREWVREDDGSTRRVVRKATILLPGSEDDASSL